jgi:uncharacterized cupin superfamily protein
MLSAGGGAVTDRVFNLRELELTFHEDGPETHRFRAHSLTGEVGATLTGMGVYELEPGPSTWPYHFELAEEEWLIVVEGEVVVRAPDGERTLGPGDVTCFPPGPAGAHAVRNDGTVTARFLMPSSAARLADGAVYPESGKFKIAGPGFVHRGWLGETVEYWEGEG